MALSQGDIEWLTERFDKVSDDARQAIRNHEERYHPPRRAIKTVGALLGIGVSGMTLLGLLWAGFVWLSKAVPR